ncbi:class II histocompatibility antigen, B-L beta chain-like isoform X2 [Anabas testudineus]|nr:class II histocompatibility antigen, B-L beta chain-like isoform X2 [Anabas testudineus]
MLMQYNSTLGKVTGYTKIGEKGAAILNKYQEFMTHEEWKTRLCRKNSQLAFNGLLNPVEPDIRLKSGKAASSKHPDMLICSAYDFYPKQIRVTWLRDGKETTSDVTSTDELSNGNWLYQIHSYLEYTPTPGEKVTCMVEHASFKKPMLYDWDPVPDPGTINKNAVGTAGLVLGVFLLVAGLIYYKRTSCVTYLCSLRSSPDSSTRPETRPVVYQESSALLPVLLVLNQTEVSSTGS